MTGIARLDPARTALLVVDAQKAFEEKEAAGERRNNPSAVDAIAAVMAAFRQAGGHIIHIRHRNTTTRMAGNLGYETFLVSDATYTFDRQGLDGRLFPAEDIQAMTLANLHDEFCSVVKAGEVEAALAR